MSLFSEIEYEIRWLLAEKTTCGCCGKKFPKRNAKYHSKWGTLCPDCACIKSLQLLRELVTEISHSIKGA